MNTPEVQIKPDVMLVTQNKINALLERQRAVAQSMGTKWLIHPNNQIKKQPDWRLGA